MLLTLAVVGFGAWAVWNFATHGQSIYLVMLTGVLSILWVTLTVGYFLLSHVFQIEAELWGLQQWLAPMLDQHQTASRRYYYEERLPARGPHDTTSEPPRVMTGQA